MSSSSSNGGQHENLGESWIEFGRAQAAAQQLDRDPATASSSPIKLASVSSKALEKLLIDAQKESSSSSSHIDSSASSRASPHSQHSSTNPEIANVTSLQLDDHMLPDAERDQLVDASWVWDWSSRPESVQPSSVQFKHPTSKKHRLSIRNTSVMRGIVFSLENLPLLIFTHACSFVFGAASMVYYLRRFSACSTVNSTTVGS